MPVHVEWYDPENMIVLSTFVGDITRAEVEEALVTYQGFLDNAERKVHFISDMRSAGKMGGFPVAELKLLPQLIRHPKMGYNVIISDHVVVHFILKTLTHLFGLRYATFGDVEEGARFLREVVRIHGL